jgi:hypothetical protein
MAFILSELKRASNFTAFVDCWMRECDCAKLGRSGIDCAETEYHVATDEPYTAVTFRCLISEFITLYPIN